MSRAAYAWLAVAVAVSVIAFVVGQSLRQDQAATIYGYELDAATYDAARPLAATSRGGFTGFGDIPGFEGATIFGGRVVEITPASLTIESTSGARTSFRLAQTPMTSRLDTSSPSSIRPGMTVVLRQTPGSDTVSSVLIVAEP